jgi:hypothetical protein
MNIKKNIGLLNYPINDSGKVIPSIRYIYKPNKWPMESGSIGKQGAQSSNAIPNKHQESQSRHSHQSEIGHSLV